MKGNRKRGTKPKRLSRSVGGDGLIFAVLCAFGAFMILPFVYEERPLRHL